MKQGHDQSVIYAVTLKTVEGNFDQRHFKSKDNADKFIQHVYEFEAQNPQLKPESFNSDEEFLAARIEDDEIKLAMHPLGWYLDDCDCLFVTTHTLY